MTRTPTRLTVEVVVNLRKYGVGVNAFTPACEEETDIRVHRELAAFLRRIDGKGTLYWNRDWDSAADRFDFTYVRERDKHCRLVLSFTVEYRGVAYPMVAEADVPFADYATDSEAGRARLQRACVLVCRNRFGPGHLIHVRDLTFRYEGF